MRIALDFDGTLADITHTKIRYARDTWGVELLPEQTWRTSGIEACGGEERYRELIRATHETELVLETPPMPGVLEVVPRLAAEHELYVVTARTAAEAAFAERWLELHGLDVRELVFTSRASKAEACRRFDAAVLLDDYPGYFVDLDAATAAALIDAPYNRDLERGDHVRLVEHWHAFEALCGELAQARRTGPVSAAR